MLQKLRDAAIYNVIVAESKMGDVEVAWSLNIDLLNYSYDGTLQIIFHDQKNQLIGADVGAIRLKPDRVELQ